MTQPLDPAAARRQREVRVVLDVRDEQAFHAGHLPGSGHVPRDVFRARRTELPPHETAVLLIADDAAAAAGAAAELEALGYADVAWLDAPAAALAAELVDRAPAVPLWRAAPFLEQALALLPAASPGERALDVAAGAGRESVHLARRGYAVEALDRDPEALERAAALAARHGVTLTTRVVNLEHGEVSLSESRYGLVVCFRYLYRPLFPRIERALEPGGHLVYETYRLGQERFGKPHRRRFLLEPAELSSAFPSLEIVHYAELEPAGGPVTARLIARRPLSGASPR